MIGGFAVLLGLLLYIPGRWWAKRELRRAHDESVGKARTDWTCEKCGGRKRLMFLRAPWLIVSSIIPILLLFIAVRPLITSPVMQSLVTYIWLALALVPAVSTLRVRCLDCEPQFKEKTW